MIIRYGQPVVFPGERTVKDVLAFVEKETQKPTKVFTDFLEYRKFLHKPGVKVVGIFKDDSYPAIGFFVI